MKSRVQLNSPFEYAYNNLQSFSKIHLSSTKAKKGKLNRDVVEIIMPIFFKFLIVQRDLCNPSKNIILLLSFMEAVLVIPTWTLIVLIPWVRVPIWGFCYFLNMSIPITNSKTGEVTIGCVQEHTGLLSEDPKLKLH